MSAAATLTHTPYEPYEKRGKWFYRNAQNAEISCPAPQREDKTPDTQKDLEKALPPSPHQLFAIPKALFKSPLWRDLKPGPRDLFLYLISYSNTRTFKDAWPAAETIEKDLGIDKRTRIRYEKKLVQKNLIRIFEPYTVLTKRNGEKHTVPSRTFRFLLKGYIAKDFRDFNAAHGSTYPVVDDLEILAESLEGLAKKIKYDLSELKDRFSAAQFVLDQIAQRIQFDSIDNQGRVHVRLHSSFYPVETAQKLLPANVLIFPQKKDVIINSRATWTKTKAALEAKATKAQALILDNPLLRWKDSISNQKAK